MNLPTLFTVAALLGGAALTVAAAETPSAQAILAASDKIRNPEKSFSMNATLIEYRAGKQTDSNVLAVYSKADPASGQFNNLIRFVTPARDANKLMLKNGNDLWFFDPSTSASVRISPQQRLLGQAANGDVVTVNLSKDYQATLAGEEEVADGEKKPRASYKLDLRAAAPDVTYERIEMWVDKASSRPIKARFYTASGRLLKTAYYRHYKAQLGQERPTETVIIDGLDPGWVTVMRFADYAWRDIPDSWLQRDYLPRFRP
ncbi:outer membrane lipoprotein-sorting protein [Massilia sp. Dwa41.01b]|uniref:outer membrane lipoprotein-sorting protein n=1 Tax=unclassified Massilia TaxID=2609279 RepID=UPI001603A1BF|nr:MULTISPECIES: outer membrane lipoprotein-sorting protein [unclassified Massilia]QNA87333.1 outer membrane lipoprotein-sorting protein [Massilia sp. Dwa41.01b]QNA98242.1 outer membrane lipoprotein-sorting protein [Massilia sp. Se16.2.3]